MLIEPLPAFARALNETYAADPRSQLGLRFDTRFAPMAEQCALARLGDPVICCGEPRQCGVHICGSSWAVSNARFFASGQAAVLLSRATARARAH